MPGPNYEDWNCADIIAPLWSKEWTVRTSSILPLMKVRVEWNDAKVVTPSFKLQSTVSALSVERVKRRRNAAKGS